MICFPPLFRLGNLLACCICVASAAAAEQSLDLLLLPALAFSQQAE
jgi:hypothetical protein